MKVQRASSQMPAPLVRLQEQTLTRATTVEFELELETFW